MEDDFEYIAEQVVKPGKTVKFTLDMLQGPPSHPEPPVLHVEHLGEGNAPYWQDAIARAEAKPTTPTDLMGAAGRLSRRERNRGLLAKFAIKKLEAFRRDGTPATEADIPRFMAKLPGDVVDLVWAFCQDAENFRERPLAAPDKLAEKS